MVEPEQPMIHVQLEESDFLQGSKLGTRWSVKRWFFVAFIPSVMYLGMGLFLMFSHATSRSYGTAGLFIMLLVPAGWLLGALTRLLYFPYRARRMFRARKRISRPFTLSWGDAGLTVDNENGHMLIPWGDFVKWLQDEQVFLLFTSRILYLNIPKRTFASSDQLADFTAHLVEKVNPPARNSGGKTGRLESPLNPGAN